MSLTTTICVLLASFQPPSGEASVLRMPADERLAWMLDQADGYAIRTGTSRAPLHRREPVLRFNDNVTGVVDAVLLVWTQNARPEVAASFWYRKDGLRAHEFVSLSRKNVAAESDNSRVWNPAGAGVRFKPIPSADAPSRSHVQRLVQMRRIARRFVASVAMRNGDLRLRLMPQPMLRYEPTNARVVDGALFSFSKGTNPEVLLLIEAERDEQEKLRFVYAPARMTSRACKLFVDETEVWAVDSERGDAPSGVYRNFYTR